MLEITPSQTRFDGEFPPITHDINTPSITLWSMRPRKEASQLELPWDEKIGLSLVDKGGGGCLVDVDQRDLLYFSRLLDLVLLPRLFCDMQGDCEHLL